MDVKINYRQTGFSVFSGVTRNQSMCHKVFVFIAVWSSTLCTDWSMASQVTEPNLQESRSPATHSQASTEKHSAEQNILYGGILRDFSPNVQSNDTDIQSIIEFALNYALEHHPKTIPKDDKGVALQPDVYHPRKLKLQYTQDGKTPFVFQEESYNSGRHQIQRKKSIIGISYFLSFAWNDVPAAYQHNFIIRKDRKHQLHLHGHTFYQPAKNVFKESPHTDRLDSHLNEISHAVPVFLPVSSSTMLDGQSHCAQDGHMTSEDQSECLEPRENVWKEGAQHVDHLTESGDEKLPTNSSVNLLSYNIWNFNSVIQHPSKKYYNDRINLLGQVVSASQADIIGYQEVRYDATENTELGPSQVTHLAKHLPNYQFVFQPAMTFRSMGQEGVALFSRYPILYHDFILLTRDQDNDEDKHQRICLHAEIETPHLGVLHVFVTHLSLNQQARERSVVEIYKYMSRHPGPAVLMGDLNAEPNSPEYKFLTGEVELQGMKTSGLIDAWNVFHPEPRPDAPGTYDDDEERDIGLTFSTLEEHLRKRIDFIFVRLPKDIKLTNVSVLDDGGRQHKAPSDHIGLQASLNHTSE